MIRTKELWIQEKERICEMYAENLLSYQEAMYELIRIGIDPHEAAAELELAR